MKVAAIQIAPIFLDKQKTWKKLKENILEAANEGASLMVWSETLIPGYPQWVSPSGGAKFNDEDQKRVYAKYWKESLTLEDSIIIDMKKTAKKHKINLMGGVAERNSGSIYCSLITINNSGKLINCHRKIKPTFEERLVWADGDGSGLRTYQLDGIVVGGLNCWENWIPHARATLHQQNEFVHIAVWPGSQTLTRDITKFMALEGRSWIVSVSGLLRGIDFDHLLPEHFPMKETMKNKKIWQDGGSIIVNPKGETVTKPLINSEGILYAEIDEQMIIEERQNFDYSGHYSRPDIFNININDKHE